MEQQLINEQICGILDNEEKNGTGFEEQRMEEGKMGQTMLFCIKKVVSVKGKIKLLNQSLNKCDWWNPDPQCLNVTCVYYIFRVPAAM